MKQRWIRVRRWATIGALGASAVGLAWRVRDIRRAPRIRVSDRVASLMYVRLVSQSVYAYAQRFSRPPYTMDSIFAHLDSAQAARLDDEVADLWSFDYHWTWCDYSLSAHTAPPPDSIPLQWVGPPGRTPGYGPPRVGEHYTWPPGVGRNTDCGGGPVAVDDSR
ncbi:MAG: hypothetical protein ACRENQ_13100 [Gemmatimonadaceae bacterium]